MSANQGPPNEGPDSEAGIGREARSPAFPSASRSSARGLKKEGWSGLDIRNANNGAPPHYRILYLELRTRPMSREHARPQPPPGRQPPAGSRRYRGGPGAGRGHRPPNQAAPRPSWTPRTPTSPSQLPPGSHFYRALRNPGSGHKTAAFYPILTTNQEISKGPSSTCVPRSFPQFKVKKSAVWKIFKCADV
jgi:hypothetical protein